MDKRELLMQQLFGDGDGAPAEGAANLQALAEAQEKADKINSLLDGDDAADAFRRLMRGE